MTTYAPERHSVPIVETLPPHHAQTLHWAQSQLFQHLSSEIVVGLQQAMTYRTFALGEVLAHKGAAGTEMFIVEHGRIRVHDDEITYCYLGPGEFAGEIALLDSSPRSATLTAAEDTRVAVLSQDSFMQVMMPSPAALQVMIRTILSRIRNQNEQMTQTLRTRNAELEMLVQERTEEIEAQSEEIRMQMEVLSETTKEKERILVHLQDSIDYAYRLQQGLFPSEAELAAVCGHYGMLHRPKSVVSGDFYWAVRHGGVTYLAVGDATGHGVPGAMMAVLVMSILNQETERMSPTMPDPAGLIQRIHERLQMYLRQNQPKSAQDGCDMAMVGWSDHYPEDLWMCGAGRPALLRARGILLQMLETGPGIGGNGKDRTWRNCVYPRRATQHIYLFTDGITDQFNDSKRKLMRSGLHNWIENCGHLPLEEQVAVFRTRLDDWQGHQAQLDDITLFVLQIV